MSTVVNGRFVVRAGEFVPPGLEEMLRRIAASLVHGTLRSCETLWWVERRRGHNSERYPYKREVIMYG